MNSRARGRLSKEIADELGISIHTVNTYLRRISENSMCTPAPRPSPNLPAYNNVTHTV